MEKKKEKKEKGYAKSTLSGSVVIMFILMALILDAVVISVGHVVYTNEMLDSYGRIGTGIAQVVVSSIDGNRVDEMMAGKEQDEYASLINITHSLLQRTPGVRRVYIYSMQRDGMHLLFDTDSEEAKMGDIVEYTDILQPYLDDLVEGRSIESFVTGAGDGRIMTSLVPVLDVRNNCVCYVGCDLLMGDAFESRNDFTLTLSLLVSIPTLIVALIAALFVYRRVVSPINKLDTYLHNYASGGKSAKDDLKEFGSDTANEILSLRDDTIKLMNDISEYSDAADKYRENVTKGIEAVMDVKNNSGESLDKYSEFARIIMDELRSKWEYGRVISDAEYKDIIRFAPLYDMGELFISNSIMHKDGKLTKEEYEKLKTHTVKGGQVISEIENKIRLGGDSDILQQMAQFHHEHWDGSGYPNGLKGEEIPLPARIIAVADTFNAIMTKKSYKSGQSINTAFEIVKNESGKQFDPSVVRAFIVQRPAIEELVEKYKEDFM